ncbi:hypothetical protein A3A76_00485 [Candidatus Woesebacteria bacterium RIFCSPLOWO2_01_FULL_39_23]|uniref:Thioredoxin domain-containing protein n=1 Tax=Candidatus Woesebacteria bacterium RIFCSPHIGHO2_01_FULL_40_22 TaxID=1802499 RepID=A0A1F7YII7_9BACT|nr:MAG: hypothetical protein A2141_05900 [Candidatus Woesebacteria bacterium RBG_16_40_11]OGM27174.1 MAG: hypothetical protein A2628_04000 [Candidatus Woesebacteria bacterium RIFCSPHIGHO2_01_FULL_40_22]OGM36910.1 MAG: hypothetical protein A3E41_05050 [Candidatus Woesebacteria bacterium RIFCSPHIGHO2_12_FULL_38_9]OGM63340.1 MAG: hypothetical protein A3A76_00485 [Candidatus Woesebacteria bacterium RIFCSPLOWO2_01_FULL_39_23]
MEENNTENVPLTRKERRNLAREEKRDFRRASAKDGQAGQAKKLKNWIVGILVVIVLFFAGYKFVKFINTPTGDSQTTRAEVLSINDTDWVKGRADARVSIIEYGDYECPACAIYYPLVKRLAEEFPDDIKVAYRDFPLPSHKKALPAARAAEAAGVQGKYWEMHNMLYEKQEEWSALSNPKDKFVEYALSLGLDKDKFLTDFDSKEVEDKITSDESGGYKIGINATPTFYINGKKLGQIRGYDDMKKAVTDALGN